MSLTLTRNVVPCGSCRVCCKNQRVVLSPAHGDVISTYDAWLNSEGSYELSHQQNGDCVYLTSDGCSVHDRAPWACRQFDCRAWLLDLLTPDDADGEIRRAALARLET